MFLTLALSLAAAVLFSANLLVAPEVWAAPTAQGPLLRSTGLGRSLSVAFNPDGEQLATGDLRGVVVRDVRTLRVTRIFSSSEGAGPLVAFSQGGRFMATGSVQGRILVYNPSSGAALASFGPIAKTQSQQRLDEQTWAISEVTAIAISPDGTYVAAAENIGQVWGSRYYTWSSTAVHVWNVRTGRKIGLLRGHLAQGGYYARVLSLAFHPNGTILASGAEDGTARLWALPAGKLLAVLRHDGRAPRSLVFTPNGAQLISITFDHVRVWNLQSRRAKILASVRCCFESMALDLAGQVVAVGLSDNVVQIRDLGSGRLLQIVGPQVRSRWVTSLALSPGGRILAKAVRDEVGQMVLEVWKIL